MGSPVAAYQRACVSLKGRKWTPAVSTKLWIS